jgi:3-dehydroquinate dehydratase-2
VARILVIHGAGMNMRGKLLVDVFGPMTLPEYDRHIRAYATDLGLDVEIFQSNIEGKVIDQLYEAQERGIDGVIFNPSAYMAGYPALAAAIGQVRFPLIEVHVSNPARRGAVSEIAKVCRGVVTGFGIFGYYMALRGLREIITPGATTG